MTWYLTDIARYKTEREGLESLALAVDWFTFSGWRMDERMRLMMDGEIAVGNRTFAIFLRYPDMFPFSPPSVFPLGDESRWSSHQFGAGGELCLEFGPDNWTPEMTGVHMIESAHRLLSLENPAAPEAAVIPSRHVESLGEALRLTYFRFLVTRELAAFFVVAPFNTPMKGNILTCFHRRDNVYVLTGVTEPAEAAWSDPNIPKPLIHEGYESPVRIIKINDETVPPATTDLQIFKDACRTLGAEPVGIFTIVVQRGVPHLYYHIESDNTVFECATIPPQPSRARLDEGHGVLKTKKVALIGCGSLGSKVGTMLARSGVGKFALIDDDLFLPDNLVRHDLDWRDIGCHKARALSRRLRLVNALITTEVRRARLGGQQANASAETLLKLLADSDLIIDATGNPDILNLMSAIASANKKPVVWAEVFGGGIGGLIARYRPDVEPPPQHMRRAIENWFQEKNAPPVRSRRNYETGADSEPLIADDADVTAIAAHTARLAIDLLIERAPSVFPHSVYAIGLGVGSVFEQPFQTFPIDVGPPPVAEQQAELSPEETAMEVDRLLQIFKARTNETAAAPGDS